MKVKVLKTFRNQKRNSDGSFTIHPINEILNVSEQRYDEIKDFVIKEEIINNTAKKKEEVD